MKLVMNGVKVHKVLVELLVHWMDSTDFSYYYLPSE